MTTKDTNIVITREVATKVRDIVDAGLVHGVGTPEPGKLCVEAAVCLALGLPHGDDPGCVSPALRRLKIALNDKPWSSNQARAAGLRRLAVAQLGSKGAIDDTDFIKRVCEMTIRKVVPLALRAAASRNPKHAAELERAAVRCETEGTREAAYEGERVARAAAAAAYAAAAAAAAADAAAADAADADAAAAAAADAAAAAAYGGGAYAAADADAAAAARTRDRVLAQFAEWTVEILIDMKAPGVEYLDLVPLAEVA